MLFSISFTAWYKAGLITLILCILWAIFRDSVWVNMIKYMNTKHDYKIYNLVNAVMWVGWLFVLLVLFGFIINS